MDDLDIFKLAVSKCTADELAHLYLTLSGEAPRTIPKLTSLLTVEAASLVETFLIDAPTTELGWATYGVSAAECDSTVLTTQFRRGVEARAVRVLPRGIRKDRKLVSAQIALKQGELKRDTLLSLTTSKAVPRCT